MNVTLWYMMWSIVMWRYDVVWYVRNFSCVENHQSKDLQSIENKLVLYVYLFIEEFIVKMHDIILMTYMSVHVRMINKVCVMKELVM